MAKPPKLEECDRVLIVEGYSDLWFFAEFAEHLGRMDSLFIKQFNGKSDLVAKLESFVTPQLLKEKSSIGVIVDADENPGGTFASLQHALKKLTGQTVAAPGVWTADTPKLGVFVAPGEDGKGEIETLVWHAWSADPANVPVTDCVDRFIDCMRAAGHVAKSPAKGQVNALLAICSDEDPRLGPGARQRIFDFERPEFASLRAFFSEL